MKPIVIAEGKLKEGYYDEEYYWAVNEEGIEGSRVRIDAWDDNEYLNVLVPELKKFKNKKVRIVLEVLD